MSKRVSVRVLSPYSLFSRGGSPIHIIKTINLLKESNKLDVAHSPVTYNVLTKQKVLVRPDEKGPFNPRSPAED